MHGLRGKNLLQFLRVTQVCMKRLYGKSITSTNERVITYRFDITCRTDSTIVAGPDIYVGRGPRAMYFAKYSGPVHLLYLPSNWTCSSAEVKDARGEYRYPKTNCLITKFTYFIPSLSTVKPNTVAESLNWKTEGSRLRLNFYVLFKKVMVDQWDLELESTGLNCACVN